MVKTVAEERVVELPDVATASVQGRMVTVKGPLGEVKKDFSHARVQIEHLGKQIIVRSFWARKADIALVGTVTTHINNMVKGVTQGYTYKLKVVFSHFPVNIKVQPGRVLIENFIGERSPRMAKIVGNAKVTAKGDDIIVQGIDLESVSQTAANIEQITKIKNKDPRVFLDGIYVYEKLVGI